MKTATATATAPQVSFDRLYADLSPKLARFLQTKGADDADDMAQEAFMRAWRAWPRFVGGREQARAWVYRIAHNLLVDQFRRRGRVINGLDESYGVAVPLTESVIAASLDLAGQLAALPERQRDVLAGTALGYEYTEMADRLGISYETVKMQCHRARVALRKREGASA